LPAQLGSGSGLFRDRAIRVRADDVDRLAARRRADAALRQPHLHLGDLALLLDDNTLSHLLRPRVLGVPQGHTSHVDSALVMGDHLDAEIHIGVAGIWQSHVAHHLVVRDLILANRWRSGRAVPGVVGPSPTPRKKPSLIAFASGRKGLGI
jgi:hypothetical protein